MVIGRKLILPSLIVIALLLVLVCGYSITSAQREIATIQEGALASLEQGLQAEISRLQEISLALGRQTASNTAAMNAFGGRNYADLLTLSRPELLNLRGKYGINGYRFAQAPAKVIVDVVNPDRAGQALVNTNSMLASASSQGRELTGLEVDANGLGIHSIVPIEGHSPSGAPVNGTVEYSLSIDATSFSELRSRYGGEWQFMLYKPAASGAGYEIILGENAQGDNTAAPDLALISTTFEKPIYAAGDRYARALEGEVVSSVISSGEYQYAIRTIPLKDFSGKVVGVVDILWDRTELARQLSGRIFTALLIGLAALAAAAVLLNITTQRTLFPLRTAVFASQSYATGDLRYPLPSVPPNKSKPDEVEQLTHSIGSIGQQMRKLTSNLEASVAERTRLLQQRADRSEAAAEIASHAADFSSTDELMAQAASLIRERFDLYHAIFYLVEPAGESLQLRAAAGEHARRLLENRQPIALKATGSDPKMIVAAAAARQIIFSTDITADPFYLPDPMLPETRSQTAIPLLVGEQVVGILDVHSRKTGAFGIQQGDQESDAAGLLTALQLLARQLAAAIYNTLLIDALQKNVSELSEVRRRQTGESWTAFVRDRNKVSGYRYVSSDSLLTSSGAGGLLAITPQESGAQPDVSDDLKNDLSVPIRLRGQTIGEIQLRFDAPAGRAQVEAVVEEVGARLALLMESARLLEEAERRAQREQQINVIGTQMRSSVDLDSVLQNTVRELGKALGARRTYIELGEFAATSDQDRTSEGISASAYDPEAEARA